MPSYTAAKAGIIGLTKGLAGKLGRDGIRVNAIAPGWVITERQKELWVTEEALAAHVAKQCIQQVMQPDDMVGPVLFLASDASRMLTAQTHDRRRRLPVTHAEPAFAAVDWGTTRFRAWLLDAAGEVVGRAAQRRRHAGGAARTLRRRARSSISARWAPPRRCRS